MVIRMYGRELARVKATQKRYEYAHYGRPQATRSPLNFGRWVLNGVRRVQEAGAEIELFPDHIKIMWAGRPSVYRSREDLRDEYVNEYLPGF